MQPGGNLPCSWLGREQPQQGKKHKSNQGLLPVKVAVKVLLVLVIGDSHLQGQGVWVHVLAKNCIQDCAFLFPLLHVEMYGPSRAGSPQTRDMQHWLGVDIRACPGSGVPDCTEPSPSTPQTPPLPPSNPNKQTKNQQNRVAIQEILNPQKHFLKVLSKVEPDKWIDQKINLILSHKLKIKENKTADETKVSTNEVKPLLFRIQQF